MVPKDWEIVCIANIADVKGGKRLPKGYQLTDENTGFPYIRVTDMRDGLIKTDGLKYVPAEAADSIKNYKIRSNDIFITVAGTLGIVGEVPDELDGANLTENADKLTNIKINKKYLLEVLRSPIVQVVIDAKKTSNAQPKLALSRIKEFLIPNPPLPEQNKIAKIISTWDKAITTTEQLLINSKQQKKALMQQLLTGKKRLRDNNGKKFSMEWNSLKLVDLCIKITDGAHHSPASVESGLPIYSVKDMTSYGFLENSARNINKIDYEALVNQGCKPLINDILIAKDGSILKHCFVVEEDIEGVVLSSIAILRPNLKKTIPQYISQYFSQEHFRFFVRKALTSGSGVPRIILKDFKGITLKIPGLLEQKKIASVLSSADQEITVLKQNLDTLKQEKKALMQQLLTGKRRVLVN